MLDIVFIIMFFFTLILMIYSLTERNIALVFLTAVLWLILALFILQGIEVPYEMYNASSGNIETGSHLYRDDLSPLSYLFSALGIIMFILFVTFTLEGFADYKKIK